MKTLFSVIIAVLFLASCDTSGDLLQYNTSTSSVYFGLEAAGGDKRSTYRDSLTYNFSLDDNLAVKEKVLKIPLRISGLSQGVAREVKYSLEKLSSAHDYSNISISNAQIGANKYVDTLLIKVQRAEGLIEHDEEFYLHVETNENFEVGAVQNSKIKIIIADRLRMPNWWNSWRGYMGKYYKEVYQKWISIYKLGVDPTPDIYGVYPAPYYSWENMPSAAVYNWYPVTFSFIQQLKDYFEKNTVYPNGDTSLTPIKLP